MPKQQIANERERVRILSLNVDVSDPGTAVRTVNELALSGGGYVCVANVHMTMEAVDDPEFADVVNAADLVIADGKPLVWMQRRAGKLHAEQVRGPSLMPKLIEAAAETGMRLGFFGATPDVIAAIEKKICEKFPLANVAYAFSPPFREPSDAETAEIVERINAAGVNILFVGLGCPKQERWMAANTGRINAVMLGVGAAFDIFAEKVPEAPETLRRIGLEWLYRFALEPKRLWRRYLILNSRFIYRVVFSSAKDRKT